MPGSLSYYEQNKIFNTCSFLYLHEDHNFTFFLKILSEHPCKASFLGSSRRKPGGGLQAAAGWSWVIRSTDKGQMALTELCSSEGAPRTCPFPPLTLQVNITIGKHKFDHLSAESVFPILKALLLGSLSACRFPTLSTCSSLRGRAAVSPSGQGWVSVSLTATPCALPTHKDQWHSWNSWHSREARLGPANALELWLGP